MNQQMTGELLKRLRKEKGLTQEQLAERYTYVFVSANFHKPRTKPESRRGCGASPAILKLFFTRISASK